MTGTTDRFLTLRLLFLFLMLGCAICLTTNHTAGAVFTTETPVIIASALEKTWVSVPLQVLPALDITALDIAFQEFQYDFAMRWKKHHGRFCKTLLPRKLMNTTYLALKGLEYEMLKIDIVPTKIRERAATYLNGTEAGLSRSKPFVKPQLNGIAAAIVLAPVLKAGFLSLLLFLPIGWRCRLG